MRDEYDIFEKLPDGSLVWRACVSGAYDAERRVRELTEISNHQCYALNLAAGDNRPLIAKLPRRESVKHIGHAKKDVA